MLSDVLLFLLLTADNYFKLGIIHTTDIFLIFDFILLAPSVTGAVSISPTSSVKLATLRSVDKFSLRS